MFKLGIRAKTILLTIVPTLTVAILLGGYFINVRLDDIHQNMEYEGANIVHQLGPLAEFALVKNNSELMNKVAKMATEDHEGVRSAALYSANGKLLAYRGLKPTLNSKVIAKMDGHVTDKLIIRKNDRALIIISTISHQSLQHLGSNANVISHHYLYPKLNQVAGYFSIEIDQRRATDQEIQAFMATIFIALIGLLISILIGLRLGRDISRPIRAIAKAVKAIKNGHLETRVEAKTSAELDTLKTGVNAMAHSLNNAREEMQHNIDKATADLKAAMNRLEGQNDELSDARKAALTATHAKSAFLANMSHEIRTPMNAMVGYTDLLMQTNLTAAQREYLEIISKSTNGLMHIINDILDFSKIEADKLELHLEATDIRRELEDTLTLLAPLAHDKGLELAFFIYDDVPQCLQLDKLRFSQIITNLVNNAIKFTEKGTVVTRISIAEETTNSANIHVEVTDTGCGLTEHQQKRLFSAFSQADTSTTRDFGGTGLGLVICQRLIHLMGGDIDLKSEPGVGSVFSFSIKADICVQADELHEQVLTGKTIGIAERLTPARMSLMQTCEQFGAEVIASPDPGAINPSDCDLLIMNAHSALETDKAHIILSNGNLESTKAKYPHSVTVLTKPVTQRRLMIALCDFWNLALPAEWQNPGAVQADSQLQKVCVLSVDDNDINLKLLDTLLSKMGVQVTSVDSGEKAIEAAQKNHFDLILMDLQMPKMDGLEATQAIKKLLKNPPPIVALTADVVGGQRERLLSNGFDDFQTKPIQEVQLYELVKRWSDADIERPVSSASENNSDEYIDLTLGTERAGGNEKVAKEMLKMLLERLPTDANDIEHAARDQNWDEVCQLVHKLHGACTYVGVPKLQQACFDLEKAIKTEDHDQYGLLVDQFLVVAEKTLQNL